MSKHLMELPSQILLGSDVLSDLPHLMLSKGLCRRGVIASGENVWKMYGQRMMKVLEKEGYDVDWVPIPTPTLESVERVEREAEARSAGFIIGFGGGKSIDVAKLAAYKLKLPLISVPTTASHDGIASPFASIHGMEKPYSFSAKPPLIVVADISLILRAHKRLISSGVGDVVAKLTAVKDWELGRDEKGEYYGEYSAKLALLSAQHIMMSAEKVGRMEEEGIRNLMEALISAGVAAGIAGSSRPCSGSEHLFSHALDVIAPGRGLHGEKVGLGTIMMAKLHGMDWVKIVETLKKAGTPVNAPQIGISKKEVIKALLLAPKLRPERYTILHKLKLNEDEAYELASSTGVL